MKDRTEGTKVVLCLLFCPLLTINLKNLMPAFVPPNNIYIKDVTNLRAHIAFPVSGDRSTCVSMAYRESKLA